MVKLGVELYEYNIKSGKFNLISDDQINVDDKDKYIPSYVFENTNRSYNKNNKFLIMEIIYVDQSNNIRSFHTVRTDREGSIIELVDITPNSLDKDMLVDAITGCEPTEKFVYSCKDRILERCIMRCEKVGHLFQWVPDVKDRLKKMNHLRLKEIYTKLKS